MALNRQTPCNKRAAGAELYIQKNRQRQILVDVFVPLPLF